MANSRTFLKNASVRHAIFVQRFAGGQLKEVLPFLERVRKATIKRLRKAELTGFSKARMAGLLKELDDDLEAIYSAMSKKISRNMKEFANEEAGFSTRMFTRGTKADFVKPTNVAIQAAIFAEPIVLASEEMTIEESLRQFSKKKRRELANVIRDGTVAGRTNEEIIGDINFITNKIQRNHSEAIVRTVTNHISTTARTLVIQNNEDILKGYEWVSTLDGNTTSICQSLDGTIYPVDGSVKPPIHWGCRSTIIPLVKDEFSVRDKVSSERPAVGSKGAETVDGRTTYNSWLKRQSAEFQDEVLGKDKGKLFREGGLPVTSFVDKNFKPLTLEQLKRTEPAAFKRAGLNDE